MTNSPSCKAQKVAQSEKSGKSGAVLSHPPPKRRSPLSENEEELAYTSERESWVSTSPLPSTYSTSNLNFDSNILNNSKTFIQHTTTRKTYSYNQSTLLKPKHFNNNSYTMAALRVQNIIRDILDDMDLRVDAEIQKALSLARHGTHPAWVDDTVNVFKVRLAGYAIEAVADMTPLVGPIEAFMIVAREKDRLLDEIDLLAEELEEVSLAKQSICPDRRRRGDSSPYIASRKLKPAPKPDPIPGEGPGPKPIPQKSKKKDVARWETGEKNTWEKPNTWGTSEKWEELAMHTAHKEKLEIKAKIKAEEEQAKAAAAKEPAKGSKGKVPAKGGNKPKA
ncbi:hypothetical protein DL98DRAFT_534552 [Cadophora sp. DSE1049]|nr:hypothetical protein DL98DRAFT_534552 [Cadophora sp. DSE1049]